MFLGREPLFELTKTPNLVLVAAALGLLAISFLISSPWLSNHSGPQSSSSSSATSFLPPSSSSASASRPNGSVTPVVTSEEYTPHPNSDQESISVDGLTLCARGCIYPAPHATAFITIHGKSPLSSLTVYVNGTFNGVPWQNPAKFLVTCTTSAVRTCSLALGGSGFTSGNYTTTTQYYATCLIPASSTSCTTTLTNEINTLTEFAFQYKGGVPDKFTPVVEGDTYVFTFVATFQDGGYYTSTGSTVPKG